MVKIKIHLGYGEIINVWAKVIRRIDHYEVYTPDGSYDKWMRFNSIIRCFEGT